MQNVACVCVCVCAPVWYGYKLAQHRCLLIVSTLMTLQLITAVVSDELFSALSRCTRSSVHSYTML